MVNYCIYCMNCTGCQIHTWTKSTIMNVSISHTLYKKLLLGRNYSWICLYKNEWLCNIGLKEGGQTHGYESCKCCQCCTFLHIKHSKQLITLQVKVKTLDCRSTSLCAHPPLYRKGIAQIAAPEGSWILSCSFKSAS